MMHFSRGSAFGEKQSEKFTIDSQYVYFNTDIVDIFMSNVSIGKRCTKKVVHFSRGSAFEQKQSIKFTIENVNHCASIGKQ